MDRKQAGGVASAIRESQGELAMRGDIAALRWIVGVSFAINLATLAVALTMVL